MSLFDKDWYHVLLNFSLSYKFEIKKAQYCFRHIVWKVIKCQKLISYHSTQTSLQLNVYNIYSKLIQKKNWCNKVWYYFVLLTVIISIFRKNVISFYFLYRYYVFKLLIIQYVLHIILKLFYWINNKYFLFFVFKFF